MAKLCIYGMLVAFGVGLVGHFAWDLHNRDAFAASLGVSSFQGALGKVSADYQQLKGNGSRACELEDRIKSSKGQALKKAQAQLELLNREHLELAARYNSYWGDDSFWSSLPFLGTGAPEFNPNWDLPRRAPSLEQLTQERCG